MHMFEWEKKTDDLKTIKIVIHVKSCFLLHKIKDQDSILVKTSYLSPAQLRYLYIAFH